MGEIKSSHHEYSNQKTQSHSYVDSKSCALTQVTWITRTVSAVSFI